MNINKITEIYQKNNYWSGGLKYPFSSKIYCKEHNTNFGRKKNNKNRQSWCCGLYIQHGISSYLSPIIPEKDLYNIIDNIMKKIIPLNNNIITSMIELYSNIKNNNSYDIELKNIDTNIKKAENKKSIALDLIIAGELTYKELKYQFKQIENELNILSDKKKDIIKQIKALNNKNNKNLIYNSIQEELNGKIIDEFIRYFLDEIIISKINNNRNNIKLDIYLNLLDYEKKYTKGSKHINNLLNDEILYIENQKYSTIETLKKSPKKNYIYNVYIKTN